MNISSFAAFEPNLGFPVSSAFRSSLASYTKLYAKRYASSGIRMNCVLPGFVDSFPEKEEIIAMIPAGRYAKVSEIANLVVFLCGDKSQYLNGESLKIDGGLSHHI